MKSPSPLSPRRRARRIRGIALVIVLGMLTLVAILITAFFASVKTELKASKSYASGASARSLADSAVNIVITQIQDATTSGSGYSYAWASQPGMIRTYDRQGAAVAAYKLYSSGTLRVSGAYDAIGNLSNEIPETWMNSGNVAVYTDLNQPVTVTSGSTTTAHYPILDPRAVAPSQSGTATALSGTGTPIEGCFLNTATGITAVTPEQTNPIPMPVEWLYVLKDGNVVAMDPATKIISGAGAVLPDGTKNEVVGRIAFWADDETCKVNINTASEGTFWDRPWTVNADNSYDLSLARSMPVQNEFQRYPGHPAMTCLSTVFPFLGGSVNGNETIYGIVPRVVGGGSKGGDVIINETSKPVVPDTDRLFTSVDELLFSGTSIISGTRQPNPTNTGTFSQDDIAKARFFLTASSRAPEVNLFNKPRIALWPLQANPSNVSNPTGSPSRDAKDRLIAFCSTVGSKPYYFQRYNSYTADGQTPQPSSQSTGDDWNNIPRNQELFAYLRNLASASIPGMGGSIKAKYPGTCDQILTEIYDFIRSNVNTFNTSATPNYYYTPFRVSGDLATGQGQVVPTVLPKGTLLPDGSSLSTDTKGFGRFPTIIQAGIIFYNKDKLTLSGTIPPDGVMKSGTITTTFPASENPSGKVLTNYVVPDINGDSGSVNGEEFGNNKELKLTGSNYTISSDTAASQNIGAVLILQPFNPCPGPPPWASNVRYQVSGLDRFYVNGGSIGFPSSAVNLVSSIDSSINQTALTGLELCFQQPPRAPKTLGATNPSNPDPQYYPFFGSCQVSGSTFSFSGGDLTIKIYQGTPRSLDDSDLVQTIHMTFPGAGALPVPVLAAKVVSSGSTTICVANRFINSFTDFNKRISFQATNTGQQRWGLAEQGAQHLLPLIVGMSIKVNNTNTLQLGDTVRSVEARYAGPAQGDYRLYTALRDVPAAYFEGHGMKDASSDGKLYTDAALSSRRMHSICADGMAGPLDTSSQNGYLLGAGLAGDKRGKLLPTKTGVTYPDPNRWPDLLSGARNRKVPVCPRGLDGAYMADGTTLGDWDNGVGWLVDGPYINIADQCTSTGTQSKNLPLYYCDGRIADSNGLKESGASFSPNRQISSAVAFGSLPTGIDPSDSNSTPEKSLRSAPWQTLLFCKNPLGGSSHPGFGMPASGLSGPPYVLPPDHVFLDFFTMPIVEPYAISEPFSTAGKVNMNYQIVPFTYLTRDTAVRAVLKSTNVTAIPTSSGSTYKLISTSPPNQDYRYTLNLSEAGGTLEGFERRFNPANFGLENTPDIFHSASEICDLYLVPKNLVNTASPAPGSPTYATMDTWWAPASPTGGYRLTGDNVREAPYGHIYPRLTTKSNTYTVHVRTQTLKKTPGTPSNVFVEGRDKVTAEYRGAFVVERYLDPGSDSLVHLDGKTAAAENDADAMVGPYKYRVISSKRFAP